MTSTKPATTRIAFVSLGCPKNLVDSEAMLGTLVEDGYQLVSEHDEADAIIINTCGFLDSAKEESLQAIGEAISEMGRGIFRSLAPEERALPLADRLNILLTLLGYIPGIVQAVWIIARRPLRGRAWAVGTRWEL